MRRAAQVTVVALVAAAGMVTLAACQRAGRGGFDGARALSYVQRQVAFGPRIPNTSGHREMGDWLLAELRQRADTVIVQDFMHRTGGGQTLTLRNFLARFRPGATELDVAEAAAAAFRAKGCEEVLFTIVAGGPNGAFPHHHSGRRALDAGDAVVIDIGARLNGYASDITRMAFVGAPNERYLEVHRVVEAAVQAGLGATRAGATCHDVDAAARGAIEEAGFGEYFVHRTGHGLGLSVHEPPWIMRGEDVELRVGMVHSIEPGIYLPGEFGVRLEEIVHVTADGCERFSRLSREPHVVEVD